MASTFVLALRNLRPELSQSLCFYFKQWVDVCKVTHIQFILTTKCVTLYSNFFFLPHCTHERFLNGSKQHGGMGKVRLVLHSNTNFRYLISWVVLKCAWAYFYTKINFRYLGRRVVSKCAWTVNNWLAKVGYIQYAGSWYQVWRWHPPIK